MLTLVVCFEPLLLILDVAVEEEADADDFLELFFDLFDGVVFGSEHHP